MDLRENTYKIMDEYGLEFFGHEGHILHLRNRIKGFYPKTSVALLDCIVDQKSYGDVLAHLTQTRLLPIGLVIKEMRFWCSRAMWGRNYKSALKSQMEM